MIGIGLGERNRSEVSLIQHAASRVEDRRKWQAMKLAVMFVVIIVAAFIVIKNNQASPLRTVHGSVVDMQGKPMPGAIAYLHDEGTNAIKTYITDHHGRFRFSGISYNTDYRIHAEHDGLMSAVRRIEAHSTNRVIKLDLKLAKKKPVRMASLVDLTLTGAQRCFPVDEDGRLIRSLFCDVTGLETRAEDA